MIQETYEIIKDDKKFLEFIDWLPELEINETFYVALFARKKYCADVKQIKTDKAQCKRFTSSKKHLYHKIKQLETPVGSYVIKDITIPQEALALYISVNPRCFKKASKSGLIKLANLVTQDYNGYNPHQEIMSEIHRNHSRKVYFDFDFDNVEPADVMPKVLEGINKSALSVIKTRGGFHLMVEMSKVEEQYRKTWHRHISALDNVDVAGDNLIPVVGCTQGGFTPKLMTADDF